MAILVQDYYWLPIYTPRLKGIKNDVSYFCHKILDGSLNMILVRLK
ncbi:hypothetical protein [Pontibacter burrus]|uniref:Uncharacterized protein n=1 Tax=Pontibacter burrus TaxID=2704466 RepID=A0A6B3LNB9_9BACT|nr:hypothetical protein [Pontibacter burrus]NEM98402.1 hypothetical protein [Pontibacter burrus]